MSAQNAAPQNTVKLFVYGVRTYDELPFFEEVCAARGVELAWTGDYPSLENAELAAGCDAVSVMTVSCPRPLIERWHELGVRMVATRTIGFDHIDVDACRELGVRVSNVSYAPESVADYAIMLAMMCLRRVPQTCGRARVQDYTLRGKLGRSIGDCTVGIVGTGHIGATLADHLAGFGCRLLAYDLYPNDHVASLATYVGLDELLAQSDVVTLHAPLTPETHHMIDARALALMKPDAVLVNTARGGLVDTGALIDALEAGRLSGGVALDVIEGEQGIYYADRVGDAISNRDMAVLRSFPHVILTPHTAFYTDVAVRQMVEGCIDAVIAVTSDRAEECPLVIA